MTPSSPMTDRDEIVNLIARVAHLTDEWDSIADVLSGYTEDCVWDLAGTPAYHGHAGLATRVQEMLEQKVCGPGIDSRHAVNSVWVTVEGDEAAAHSVLLFCVGTSSPAPQISVFRYHDRLRRTAAGWKIAERKTLLG
jgi:ketosteroid isomerase-like protein